MSSSSLTDQYKNNEIKSQQSLAYRPSLSSMLEWVRMLVTGIVLLGLYIKFGGPELLFLSIVSGIVMLGGLSLYLFGPKRVEVNRMVIPGHSVVAGGEVEVTVVVSFRARIPLPWMTISDRWSGGSHQELLFPGFRRTFTYTYSLTGLPRGVHQLEDCCVRWGDLPGWFTGREHPKGKFQFKVLPAPLSFGRIAFEGGNIPGESAVSPRGRVMDEGKEIRDYRPGDPMSRIHWKSTARRGSLQTLSPARENDRMICIILDNNPKSYAIPSGLLGPRRLRGSQVPAFERAVSAAMGLMLSAEKSGAYVQWFSGGWPEGVARHEGLGKIPGRVLSILTEIMPDGTRSLPELLEDASRGFLPGMSMAVITGGLEPESAKAIARLLAHGVKVNLYYAWDKEAPASGGSIGDSLMRLGAGMYCLEHTMPAFITGEEKSYESSGK